MYIQNLAIGNPLPPNLYPKTYKTGTNLRLHLFEIQTIVEIEAPIQAMHSESTNEIKPEINFLRENPSVRYYCRGKAKGGWGFKFKRMTFKIFIIIPCFFW
jgi:hypothetical protein